MAQKKKKSSGSVNPKVKKAEARIEAKAVIRDEIIGVVIMAVGVFLIIALQTKAAGIVGEAIGEFLKGCFGFGAFLLPYYFLVYGLLLFLQKTIHISIKSTIYLVVIYLMMDLINAGRFTADAVGHPFPGISQYYADGVLLKGGGVFGMGIGVPLTNWIGVPGLYILSFVSIFIFILLIVNTPVSRFFENIKLKKQRMALEREEREREKERRRRQQAEAKPAPALTAGSEPKSESMTDGQRKIMGYVRDRKGKDAEKEADPVSDPVISMPVSEPRVNKLTKKEASATLSSEDFNESTDNINYEFPPIDILKYPEAGPSVENELVLRQKALKLEETLRSFNIDAEVTNVTQGPAVTRYEVHPSSGVKVKGIKNLADDIALNMEAKSIRIEAPIPGKAAVGIEIENENINMVTVREIIESPAFKAAKSKLTVAIGKDIAGKAIIADLKAMPHMLIAGSTGSGKSVCVNSIITSILYKARPDEVKMVLIDPKVVELSHYNNIPHLLIPVVTEPAKAAAALNWAVTEMDERYKKFAELGVRELSSYNKQIQKKKNKVKDGEVQAPMPQVVIVIDELADLMMAAPSQVEESICRLAQKARAAGMHLIVATQRPSVDVITGLIKANIPSRIAFAVSSQIDSRTILDMAGAEKLVGKGDMLFNPLGSGKPTRVQGTFISDEEVLELISFVKAQAEVDEAAADQVMDSIAKANMPDAEKGNKDFEDELLPEAIELVVSAGQASVSMLQRRFRVGYNRAARLIDMMEARQIVGPSDGSRPRQVLISEEELQIMKDGSHE